MTKPPTAEEVLGLYREWQDAVGVLHPPFRDGYQEVDFKTHLNRCSAARYRFNDAWKEWQAAQGPVTREWFKERFGGEAWLGTGIACVAMCNDDGVYFQGVTKDATRSDIETIVRVLGGEECI